MTDATDRFVIRVPSAMGLELRIRKAKTRQSIQSIIIEALEDYLKPPTRRGRPPKKAEEAIPFHEPEAYEPVAPQTDDLGEWAGWNGGRADQ